MTSNDTFMFRLYTSRSTDNSAQALTNLRSICDTYLPLRHKIEVIDAFQYPKRALADRICMTPTLIKLGPGPVRRIVGTLTKTERVLLALGVDACPPVAA